MYIFALDTTSQVGGLALLRNGALCACLEGDASRTHGVRLPGDIARLLESQQVRLRDIDLYGVTCGPGGFTGLRVGMATIQALALVHRRPVVAVSALDAAARAALDTRPAAHEGDLLGVWLDAHRGEVFSAMYGLTSSGRQTFTAEPIEQPAVGAPASVAARWRRVARDRRLWLTGNGVRRHPTAARSGAASTEIAIDRPLVATVAMMAAELARRGAGVSPHRVAPLYVRRPDAELARARREGR